MIDLNQLFEKVSNQHGSILKQLFSHMPQSLYQQIQYIEIPARKVLVREQFPADTVYVLLNGSIQAMNQQSSGEVYAFAKFSSPELFGEFEAFSGSENYRCSLISITPCKLLAIDKEVFYSGCSKIPKRYFHVPAQSPANSRIKQVVNVVSSS